MSLLSPCFLFYLPMWPNTEHMSCDKKSLEVVGIKPRNSRSWANYARQLTTYSSNLDMDWLTGSPNLISELANETLNTFQEWSRIAKKVLHDSLLLLEHIAKVLNYFFAVLLATSQYWMGSIYNEGCTVHSISSVHCWQTQQHQEIPEIFLETHRFKPGWLGEKD